MNWHVGDHAYVIDTPREAMADVVTAVQPGLRDAGFRKRANSFNRTIEPGLVQVISYRMGHPLPPGTAEFPGFRESPHGLFTAEAGVFIEEAWQLEDYRFGPTGPPEVKTWVNTHHCQLRRAFENPAGTFTHIMWPLGQPGIRTTMVEILQVDIQVLDLLRERDGQLSIVELDNGTSLRVRNVAWGYDAGDSFAHVISNISPNGPEEDDAFDFFFTSDVAAIWSAPPASRLFLLRSAN